MLRDADKEYLKASGYAFVTYRDGNLELLVIENYGLPDGYSADVVELLIQVPDGYPDAKLDMWWVFPSVTFSATNAEPHGSEQKQPFSAFTPEPGRVWQRFSRHPNWRVGVDDLHTYLTTIRATFEREVPKAA